MKKLSLSLIMMFIFCIAISYAPAEVTAKTIGPVTVCYGPSAAFDELLTLPADVKLKAIEYETDRNSDTTWFLVEYSYNGELYRGYVMDTMPIVFYDIDDFPEVHYQIENNRWQVAWDEAVYAAPSRYAAGNRNVEAGKYVTVLRDDGDYIFIEYELYGQLYRGYISSCNRINLMGSYGESRDDFDFPYDLKPVSAEAKHNLPLRTGPGTRYSEITSIPKETVIRAFERVMVGNEETWVQLEFSRNQKIERGYTKIQYITAQRSVPWEYDLGNKVSCDRAVTVLAAPSAGAESRSMLNAGQSAKLLRYEGDYAYIEYPEGKTLNRGYVDRNAVSKVKSPAEPTKIDEISGERYDKYSKALEKTQSGDLEGAAELYVELNNWADCYYELRIVLEKLLAGSKNGEAHWLTDYVSEPWVVNCNEWISMRERPDKNSKRLCKIPRNALISPCFDTNGAYAVGYYDGLFGFIHKQFLYGFEEARVCAMPGFPMSYSEDLLEYVGECEIVNCEEWVSMREKADSSSTRLGKIPKGAVVTQCFNTLYDYALCNYNGKYGFIHKQYLSGFQE